MEENMRRARQGDIEGILRLLSQVLEVHAAIRPDLFISGRTKYTADELSEMIQDDSRPIYVAVDDVKVKGYAFCMIKEQPATNVTFAVKEMYLDDLCVDESCRGTDVAANIFEYVKERSAELGCRSLTLNVWEGNIPAERFYKKMGMKPRKTMMEISL